jgi:DNA repair photolyase
MMPRPGVPAPGFVKRFGQIVDERRAVRFQELTSRDLMNRLNTPGMPFDWTLNPFRGCELGCLYCYARPTHEYLGHSEPEEFEQHIYVKRGDTGRLRETLRRACASGHELAIGTATDPYQPAEGRFEITRSVLREVRRVPGLRVGITTKSTAITRDRDLLAEIARTCPLTVNVSLISLDADLLRRIEPRAPRPDLRLRALRVLAEAGIPTRLFVMPVLPVIPDGERSLRELLEAGRGAGAREAISNVLFLRGSTRTFFLDFVKRELPWALPRYLELYRESAYAPRDYRDAIEQRVRRLCRELGFESRTREDRMGRGGQPRQLALTW